MQSSSESPKPQKVWFYLDASTILINVAVRKNANNRNDGTRSVVAAMHRKRAGENTKFVNICCKIVKQSASTPEGDKKRSRTPRGAHFGTILVPFGGFWVHVGAHS